MESISIKTLNSNFIKIMFMSMEIVSKIKCRADKFNIEDFITTAIMITTIKHYYFYLIL